jgi:hypothetical protein
MSTQATASGSNQILPGTKIKRFLSYGLVAIVSMVLGLIIGFTVLPKLNPETEAASQPAQPQMERNQPQHPDLIAQEPRPLQAETDRYTGLAKFYSTTEESRPFKAEAARYTGLAQFYNMAQESRSLQAETDRYTGLAEFYSSNTSASLAANPELMMAQRYTAAVDNETGEPATADIEALRAKSFDDWRIEAQVPDVRSVINPIKDYVSGQPATFDIEALRAQYFKEWRIEADTVDTSLTHSHSVILADNPELSLASRYSDYVQWRRLHHPGR